MEFDDELEPPEPFSGAARPRKATAKRPRLEQSFRWGAVSFRYRKPTPQSLEAFQVDCLRRSHIKFLKNGRRSMCCKPIRFEDCDREDAIRHMKFWVVKELGTPTRAAHGKWFPRSEEVPLPEVLEAMCVFEREVTDDEAVKVAQGVHTRPSGAARGRRAKSARTELVVVEERHRAAGGSSASAFDSSSDGLPPRSSESASESSKSGTASESEDSGSG